MPGVVRYVSFRRCTTGEKDTRPGEYHRALQIVDGRSSVLGVCRCPSCEKTFSVGSERISMIGLVEHGHPIACPHCASWMQVRLMEWA